MGVLLFFTLLGKNAFKPDASWACRWLKRNNYAHRAATKDAKKISKNPEDTANYLARIALAIKDYKIPPELVCLSPFLFSIC